MTRPTDSNHFATSLLRAAEPEMKKRMLDEMGDLKYEITWTTLAEYLQQLEKRGVSTNVASFIGATTIREHVIGLEDKQPTAAQLGLG